MSKALLAAVNAKQAFEQERIIRLKELCRLTVMNVNYFYRSTTIIIPDLLPHVKSYYQDFSEAAETEGARRATGVFAASKSFYEYDCISSFAFFLL